MKTDLIIDVSNLAYRAFHTVGGLSYEGAATGVLYGIFRDIIVLKDRFEPDRIAFCFDSKTHKRREVYPEYKANRRKPQTDEMVAARTELYRQLNDLRNSHLPNIGYYNVFYEEGYEADDLIASICFGLEERKKAGLPVGGDVVIVSTDQDLFQLLRCGRVLIYNPVKKKVMTEDSFSDEYGIRPGWWSMVKALAGCTGDGVPGIPGVGEKTAIKYLTFKLKCTAKAFKAIASGYWRIRDRNFKLVSLPFDGTPELKLTDDRPTMAGWNAVMGELGFESLRNMRLGTR